MPDNSTDKAQDILYDSIVTDVGLCVRISGNQKGLMDNPSIQRLRRFALPHGPFVILHACLLPDNFIEPPEHFVVPLEAIRRFEYPMVFVWEQDESTRNSPLL